MVILLVARFQDKPAGWLQFKSIVHRSQCERMLHPIQLELNLGVPNVHSPHVAATRRCMSNASRL